MTPWPSPTNSTTRVAELRVRPVVASLPRPWGNDVTTLTYLETTVVDSDGAEGHGFSWTPTIGAASVTAMLEHDIRSRIIGGPVDPTIVWEPLWRSLHEGGSGGITTIAMAGLDLALWDLAGVRSGAPVAALLGSSDSAIPTYGSGINLHYDLAELRAQARSWVERGYSAVKIKVGSPDVARDLERLKAVREIIGNRSLMIDANQRWTREEAASALDVLATVDPAWIEEPLRADDLDGYRWLAQRTDIPIACGENVYTAYRFGEFARSGAVHTLQPNIIRIGGITPLADIDDTCSDSGIEVALHLLPELSAQLAGALRRTAAVEVIDGAELAELGVLSGPAPVAFRDGWAVARPHTGLGIRFSPDPLEAVS